MARRLARSKRKAKPGVFRMLLRLLSLATLVLAGWMAYFTLSSLSSEPNTGFVIERGNGLSTVSRKLEQQGVISHAWSFTLLGRALGMANKIKAGSYQVGLAETPYQLLRKITQGETLLGKVTIVEGWSFAQMRTALDASSDLRHDTHGLTDSALMEAVGAAESKPEGLFYPDTYYYEHGSSDLDIYRRAYKLLQVRLQQAWDNRVEGLPYRNPMQLLTLASIIEKETGAPEERPLIAAVFINRLRLGMRLQTDPTVIYGLGDRYDGNLRKNDLLQDTPYNTYTRAGLPPGPISLPGGDSLQAAVNPEASKALYFVAKGGGRHQFSTNLDDHNRAVNRYQRGQ